MKKLIGGFLITALALSNLGMAFATVDTAIVETKAVPVMEKPSMPSNSNLTEAQAEKIIKGYIKKYFELDVDKLEGEVQKRLEFREDWNKRQSYVWSMNVHRFDRDGSLGIDIAISDNTGKIVNMNRYEHKNNQDNQVAKFTREEAQTVAETFLKKVNGDILHKLDTEPTEEPYYHIYNTNGIRPTDHRFFFSRLEDGIEVAGNGVSIGVNSGTGQVTNYSYNWTEENLPNKNNIISMEEAKGIYKDQLDIRLMYVPVMGNEKYYPIRQKPSEVKLVYVPNFEAGNMIDAHTGERLNYAGKAVDALKKIDVTEEQKKSFLNLVDKPARQSELTKEEATVIAEEILGKIFDEKVTIIRTNFYSSQHYYEFNGKKVWQINFRVGENQYEGNISIDALTEEVLNFHHFNHYRYDMMMMEGEKPANAISPEDAYNKSIEILKAFYPGKMKSIKTEYIINENVSPEIYFNFQRIENDILFQHNHIGISIDSQTGKLVNLYYRWDDIELPQIAPKLTKEEAIGRYLDNLNIKLQYQTIYPNTPEEAQQIKLVYSGQPKEMHMQYIDALDGTLLDYNGTAVKSRKEKVDSIRQNLKSHNHSKELTLMYENDVIDLDSFKLTDNVTKNEAIKMMVLARGYYGYMGPEAATLNFTDVKEGDPYYQYIQAAVAGRIIENKAEEFNGDEILTREDMAAMVIKMSYLDKVAEAKGIYQLPVQDLKDIDPELIGHVALAYGLDIIKGTGNNFRPKANITMAEAAVAIYRIMELMGNRLY